MASSAGDIINLALGLDGILAEGETPSAATSQTCLTILNQMLESWSIERLSVFNTQEQIFTWPSGEITRTLGPSGDFVGNRPVLFDDATYYKDTGTNVSYGITFINQQQYDGIAVKDSTSTYPQVAFTNMEYPNARITIHPKPTQALEWHFVSVEELSTATVLATSMDFPPGYERAFVYGLAVEIAPFFGIEPPATAQRIATASKRNIKRINNPDDVMAMPSSIITSRQRYNIYVGNY